MKIRLYSLGATVKRNMTTKTLGDYIELDGQLRDSMDMINPTIVIDISTSANLSTNNASPTLFINLFRQYCYDFTNYVYIVPFNRYYFVKKVTLLRDNLFSLELHIDVLMTYRDFIKKQTAFVSRNATYYDELLPDERRIVTHHKEQTIFRPTRSEEDLVNTVFNTELDYAVNSKRAVVNFIRDSRTNDTVTNLANAKYTSILPNIPNVSKIFNFNACYYSLVTTISGLVDVVDSCLKDSDIASFCGGVYVYPFEVPEDANGGLTEPIYYGVNNQYIKNYLDQPTYAKPTKNLISLSEEIIIEDFTISDDYFEDFNDMEPYSQYEIFIPYYGWKVLNFTSLRNHRLIVYYVVNYATNNATVYLYDYSDELIIFSSDCVLGIEIPISSTNIKEVNDRITANRLNLSLNLVGSMLSMGVGAVGGNPLAVAGGALSATKALGQALLTEATNYERGQVQYSSGSTATLSPQNVYIRKVKSLVQYPLNASFLSEQGGICNSLMQLSNLANTGYTEIADMPNIVYGTMGFGNPTDNEIDEIIVLLKNGVIFNGL